MAKDQERKKITRSGLQSALNVFKYIKPYRAYFFGALSILVIGSILMMMIMGIPGEMVNVATGAESRFPYTLNQWGIIMLVILAIRAFLSFVQTILFANVSEKGMANIRTELYGRLITQSMEYFEGFRVGELTSRITADVEQLQSVFSITLAEFIRQILILIFGISILAYLMPSLFLIMLLVIPVVVVLAMTFGKYIKKLSKRRQDQLAKTNVIVEETLQSFSIVKAFSNEPFEVQRYAKSIDKMVGISISFAKVKGLFFAFLIFLLFGSILFILWRGAFMVQSGDMEAGSLLSFVIYTVMIGGAIASLGNLYTTIASALGATERVQKILERPQELESYTDQPIERIEGDIVFDNVHFSYPSRSDIPVLKGVDISIGLGKKIALVGQSGSGKSTIVRLLMKFYGLNEGGISIGGKAIESYDLRSLRRSIGLVPQEVILFGGSIRENLLYGKPDATESELIEAAKKSHSWEFISTFPEGFDTLVGERGIKLSGGQKQRIAIARTILKDPAILLLDEATSSLDAESERLVQEAMDELMKGRTSIIIAHRLATIRNVDRIYVLEDGEIVEQGTHDDLTKKEEGVYKNLAKLQFNLSDQI